jgi:hypothetical protein
MHEVKGRGQAPPPATAMLSISRDENLVFFRPYKRDVALSV